MRAWAHHKCELGDSLPVPCVGQGVMGVPAMGTGSPKSVIISRKGGIMGFIRDEKEGQAILKVDGELTVYEVAGLREALLACFEENNGLTLDLGDVKTCDTAGIQLLLSAQRTARDKEKKFVFSEVSKVVMEVADRVGIDFDELGIRA